MAEISANSPIAQAKLAIGQQILITLWVGGLWVVGYLVVPTVFAVLEDRQLAGQLAVRLFTLIAYIGLICGGLTVASSIYVGQWRSNVVAWIATAMLFLVSVGLFVVQPMMAGLRAEGLFEGTAAKAQFDTLHQIASAIYLVTSLLGLALVAYSVNRRR